MPKKSEKKAAKPKKSTAQPAAESLPKRTVKAPPWSGGGTITRKQARDAVRAVLKELKAEGVKLTPAFEDE